MKFNASATVAIGLLAVLGLAISGCAKPSFMQKDDDGVRSGGPSGGGPAAVNTVTMAGGDPFAAGAAPASASASASGGKRERIGDKSAHHSYAAGPDAPYPGFAGGRSGLDGADGILDQDVYAATNAGLLDKSPDFYPMGPGAHAQSGIDVNASRYAAGVYGSPDSLARMVGGAEDLAGMMRMTYTTNGGDHNVSLTRDGRYMIYSSTRWGKNPQIARQRVGGRAVERLTQSTASDMMPAVSPDNQILVWSSNRFGSWNLLARELDAPPQSAPVRLTDSPSDDLHPSWSHDGKLLAFSRYNPMDGQWELWVMDFPRRLLTCVGPGLFPSFCPVSKRSLAEGQPVYTLAFQNHRQRDIPFYSVWTMDVAFRYGKVEAVGAPTEIVASADWAAITPAWSPDGGYLAFASVRQSPTAQMQARLYRADEIWVVRADGSELVAITDHAAPDWYPHWAPEENNPMGRLYFTSSRNGFPNIWSVRPNVPGLMQRYVRRGAMPSPR